MPNPASSAKARAPRIARVSLRFQHQDAGGFGEHGAVVPLGEREAPVGREEVEGLTCQERAVGQRAVDPADDGDVHDLVADVVGAERDGVRGARSGAAHRERRAFDPILDADVGGCRRSDDARQQHGMHRPLAGEEAVTPGYLDADVAAGGGADDARDAVRIGHRPAKLGLSQRFVGRRRGEPAEAAGMHDALVAPPLGEAALMIEIGDAGRNADPQLLVDPADGADSGFARAQGLPEIGNVLADRRHGAHASDDDTRLRL